VKNKTKSVNFEQSHSELLKGDLERDLDFDCDDERDKDRERDFSEREGDLDLRKS
jgi:hypothetical protein